MQDYFKFESEFILLLILHLICQKWSLGIRITLGSEEYKNLPTVHRREYYIQVFNVEADANIEGGCVYFYVCRRRPLFCKTKCWWQRQPQKGHHRPRRRRSSHRL